MTGAEWFAIALVVAVCATLMAGYPVAFTLGGVSLIFAFLGSAFGYFDLFFLAALPQRVFGVMTNGVLLAIPLFIFMGVMLERSRIAEDLLETMGRLFGPLRGGLGISVIIVGLLLAAAKGVVGATVVTMGLIVLPAMLRFGYDPRLVTPDSLSRLHAAATAAGVTLKAVGVNPLDAAWGSARPAQPAAAIVPQPLDYAGLSSPEKRAQIARNLTANGVAAALITAPSSLAWLFNIRGGDVIRSPLPLGQAVLKADGSAELFVEPVKISEGLLEWLGNEVSVKTPSDIPASLRALEGEAVLTREAVGGGAAGEEVEHHLRGHFGRVGADAGAGQAVVGGEDGQARALELGAQRLLHPADLQGQRLQLAERAERLGLAVDGVAQGREDGGVGGGNGKAWQGHLNAR